MMGGFDFTVITANWEYLAKGLRYTVQVTLFAMAGGIMLGTFLALMRLSSIKPLSLFAAGYVNLFRSIPLVQVILAFYLIIPIAMSLVTGEMKPIGAENSAYFTFTIFEAAYYSEIMRAGIQSVSRGQVMAGQALGMTYWQSMGLVILPQAFRNMLPILLTQTIILFQDTSLVYAIGAKDLLKAAEIAGKNYNRPMEMYVFAAVIYFVLCLSLSTLVKRLQKRIAIVR